MDFRTGSGAAAASANGGGSGGGLAPPLPTLPLLPPPPTPSLYPTPPSVAHEAAASTSPAANGPHFGLFTPPALGKHFLLNIKTAAYCVSG